jgi:hypothetical protein
MFQIQECVLKITFGVLRGVGKQRTGAGVFDLNAGDEGGGGGTEFNHTG